MVSCPLWRLGLERRGHLTGIDVARSNRWDSDLEMPGCWCLLPDVCFQCSPSEGDRGRAGGGGGVRLREHLEEIGSSWWLFPSRPLGDHEDARGGHHSDPQGLPPPGGQDHRGGQEAGLPRDHHARSGLSPWGGGWGSGWLNPFFLQNQLLPFLLLFSKFSRRPPLKTIFVSIEIYAFTY